MPITVELTITATIEVTDPSLVERLAAQEVVDIELDGLKVGPLPDAGAPGAVIDEITQGSAAGLTLLAWAAVREHLVPAGAELVEAEVRGDQEGAQGMVLKFGGGPVEGL